MRSRLPLLASTMNIYRVEAEVLSYAVLVMRWVRKEKLFLPPLSDTFPSLRKSALFLDTHSPMANERGVIDLTMSSSDIEIIHEQNTLNYPQEILDERTGSRRKGLKTVLADTGSQWSATQSRERSAEEGQVAAKNGKKPFANGTRNTVIRQPIHASPREQEQSSRSSLDSCLPTAGSDMKGIFFIDVQPAPVLHTEVIVDNSTPPLLLPAHVSIFGNEPIEILPPDLGPPGEEEYIDYLDLDDRRDATVRYLCPSFLQVLIFYRISQDTSTINPSTLPKSPVEPFAKIVAQRGNIRRFHVL